ncbi:MAG: hypothetical protein R3F49_22220 [Planctomycetota bacterium]
MHRIVLALTAALLATGCIAPRRSAGSGIPPTLTRGEAPPPPPERAASEETSFLGWAWDRLFGPDQPAAATAGRATLADGDGTGRPVTAAATRAPGSGTAPRTTYGQDGGLSGAATSGLDRDGHPLDPGDRRWDGRAGSAGPGRPVGFDPQGDGPRWEDTPAYDWRMARFAITLEGSRAIRGGARLWGAGVYAIPSRAPVGVYVNARLSNNIDEDPDLTGIFAFNAQGHDITAEGTEAFVVNVGAVRALNDSVNLFAGVGYASTDTYAQLHDPNGVFLGGANYYQRRKEDTELNLNFGALILVQPVAVTVQWDTALEVFTFGLGVSF